LPAGKRAGCLDRFAKIALTAALVEAEPRLVTTTLRSPLTCRVRRLPAKNDETVCVLSKAL
jgi:hypothetical protein